MSYVIHLKLREIIFKPFIICINLTAPADSSDFSLLGVSILLFGILPDLQFAYKVQRKIKLYLNGQKAYFYILLSPQG